MFKLLLQRINRVHKIAVAVTLTLEIISDYYYYSNTDECGKMINYILNVFLYCIFSIELYSEYNVTILPLDYLQNNLHEINPTTTIII